MSIVSELFVLARRLRSDAGLDLDRLCLLVNNDEWRELDEFAKANCRHYYDTDQGITGMRIMELEVRKRGS